MQSGLDELIESIGAASRQDRIGFRDALAAYGQEAIEAVLPWLADAELGAFAVRVISAAAIGEARTAGIAALRNGRATAATDAIRQDIEFHLERLGAGSGTVATRTKEQRVLAVPATAGDGWPGFQANEFGQIAGTSWRSRNGRTSLAPLVTLGLRYHHPHFESYAIDRSPEIHFAVRERYRQGDEHAQGWRAGKLVIYAHGPGDLPGSVAMVTAGLYLEKGFEEEFEGIPAWSAKFGLVDDRWDWRWFIRALRSEHVRDELGRAMALHDLTIGDYFATRVVHSDGRIGWTCRLEDGIPVTRDAGNHAVGRGWDDVVKGLGRAPLRSWANLHIWRSWPAPEAIAAGRPFAVEALLPVLESLTGVYLDIVEPVLPRISRT